MKKFQFNLEGLLTLREWEEQQSRQELGLVFKEIERLNGLLANLSNQVAEAFAAWNENSSKSFSPTDRHALSAQLAELESAKAKAHVALQEAFEKREVEMDRLALATRRKKVVENLKQKRLEEYKAEFSRQEIRENEDLFNSRYKGRMES